MGFVPPGQALSLSRSTQKIKQEVLVRGCGNTKDPFVGERESNREEFLEKADDDENRGLAALNVAEWSSNQRVKKMAGLQLKTDHNFRRRNEKRLGRVRESRRLLVGGNKPWRKT